MGMSDNSMNILESVKSLLGELGVDVDYNMDNLLAADKILSTIAKFGVGKTKRQKISHMKQMVKLAIGAAKFVKDTRKAFPGPKAKIEPGTGAYSDEQVRLARSGGVPPSGKGSIEYVTPMRRMLSLQDKYSALAKPTFKERTRSIFGRKGSTGELYLRFKPKGYELVTAQDAMTLRQMRVKSSSNLGVGKTDDFSNIYIDTNAFYREGPSAPAGLNMFPLVTKEQADEWEKERQEEKRADKKKEDGDRAFQYDMSDKYDQRIQDLTERYGGDSDAAEFAYKKILLKELPPFFKNSKMSAKELHKFVSGLKEFRKANPVISGMMRNPVSSAAGLIYAAMLWGFNKSDEGNKNIINWSNARNLYGKGSDDFMRAAYMAGESDPGSISRRLGKQAMKYGGSENAEKIYQMFGEAMAGMSQTEKMYFAEAIGFDEKDVAIAEMISGKMNPSAARKIGGNKAMIEAEKIMGFASGAGMSATAKSLWLSIPGMSSAQARDIEGWASFDAQRKAAIESYNETMDSAMADERYESQSVNNSTVTSGDTTVTVNNTVTVPAGTSVEEAVEGATKGSINAAKRTGVTDSVATGFNQ